MTAEEARKLTDPRAVANRQAAIREQIILVDAAIQSSIEEGRYFTVVNIPLHIEVKSHYRNLGYSVEGSGPRVDIYQIKTKIRW